VNVVTLNAENLARFRDVRRELIVRRVFIVGASGAGKSTLWATLRNIVDTKAVLFPSRAISRPPRPDDDEQENHHLSAAEFEPAFNAGKLSFFWSKPLPTGNEFYGFPPVDATTIVYGCNNAFLSNRSSIRTNTDLFQTGITVLVTSSPRVRAERLGGRYADVNVPKAELNYRLADSGDAIRAMADIIVNNDTADIQNSATELRELLLLPRRL
jgi:ribose 1,5-bisphosphokinase PhnN